MKNILYKKTLSTLFFILFFLQAYTLFAQNRFSSDMPGNWSSTATWHDTVCGGSGGGTVPSSLDDVVICGGTITLDMDVTVNSLAIQSGGSLQLAGFNLTVTGLTDIDAGGTFIHNAGGNTVIFNGIFNNNGIFRVDALSQAFVEFNGVINNNGSFLGQNAGHTFTFRNNINNQTNADFNLGNNAFTRFETNTSTVTNDATTNDMIFGSVVNNGSAVFSNANVTFTGGIAARKIIINGHSGTGAPQLDNSSLTNNYAGILQIDRLTQVGTGNSFTNNQRVEYVSGFEPDVDNFIHSATSTFTYAILGNATVKAATYGNLIINGAGTKTLNGTPTIAENLTITNAILALNTNNLTVNGVATVNTNGQINSGSGVLTFPSGSTYTHARDGGVIPTATWDANSTCLITGVTSPLIMGGFNQIFGNFTYNSTGQTTSQTIDGNMTVMGNLTIMSTGSGAFGITSNYNLTLKGNLIRVAGILNCTAGKVIFSGIASQSITKGFTFYDLEINNSMADVSLSTSTPITISNTLTLTSGKLVLGANELSLSNGIYTNQLSGGTASSYIVTDINGKLTRQNVSSGIPSLFPIGTITDYTPISIINTGGAFGSVSVFVRDAGGLITQNPKVNRIWNIQTTGATNPMVKFDWNSANESSPLSATAKIHQNSTAWTNAGIITSYTAGTQTATATIPAGTGTTSRDFAFFEPISSPTALAATNQTANSFTANWTSTGATTYEVEISTDGVSFTSAGTTSSTSLAIGSLSPNQVYYYRVKSTTPLSAVSNVKFTSTILPVGSGRALTFGGSSQVSIGTSSDYNFNGATNFTLEAWIKTNDNTLTQTIIHRGATSPTTFRNYWFGLAVNKLVLSVIANSTQQDITSAATNGVITNGDWHHVAVVVSNTGGVTFYINGISYAGSAPISGTFNNDPTATLQIGYEEGLATGNAFNGEIDEAKIWNTVRSQTQIRTDMCRKISNTDISSGSYDNMIMYFRFDENTGVRVENRAKLASTDAVIVSTPFVVSGAALGDVSVNDYSSTNLSLVSGIIGTQNLSVPSIGRTNTAGVHIYRVNSAPNLTLAVPPLSTPVTNNEYFGVFLVPTVPVVGIISSTIEYDYGTVPTTNDNIGTRTVNGIGSINWYQIPTTTSGSKLVSTAQSSGEYIPATSFTYYSRVATGDWSNGSTWSTSSHIGGSCGCTPPIGANVQIAAGHTITRDIPIYSNIINLAGTLDLKDDPMPYTIAMITNSVGNGKLKIGGASSASSIALTTGNFFTIPSNVVEFYGDASYTAPARDYPSIALTHTLLATPRTIVNVSGFSFTIYGNINGSANTDFNVNPDVTFSTTLGTHSLSGNLNFFITNINGNTTISSGNTKVRNALTIASGVILTNNGVLDIDGSAGFPLVTTIQGAGDFVAGNGSLLDYNSGTPIGLLASQFDVSTVNNTVRYSAGAPPLSDDYQDIEFRNATTTALGTVINAENITLENAGFPASLILANNTIITVNNNLTMNSSGATLDFGTGTSTVIVKGNLSGNAFSTIKHNPSISTDTQILELQGATNIFTGLFNNNLSSLGRSLVKYSRSSPPSASADQQVFASPNYQNLEIAGGGIKSLQGDVTVNKELKLTLGVLDISNIPASNLIIGQNATIVNGSGNAAIGDFNATNFISTSGGLLKKEFSSPLSNFVFPIGEAGKYAPMVADMTSYTIGTGIEVPALSVKPITGNQTNLVSTTNALNKYWATYTTNVSNIDGDLKFYYDDSEVRATLANEPNYISGYYTGSVWVIGNTAAVNEANNEIAFAGLTGDWGNRSWTAGEFAAFIPTYYSNDATAGIGSVDWNLASTWALGSHSGTAPTIPPPAGATVIIAPNHKIDVNATAINVGTLSLGGELNLRDVPSHTITTLNDNVGTGNLIFEGTNSASILSSTIATSYKSVATNKITFGGATYTIPQTNYPTLKVDGTGLKSFASPSIPIDILGDLLVVGTALFDANGNTVNFTAGNPNPHQIIVDGIEAKFHDIGILGNTTLSLGTSTNVRLCEVAGIMSIGEGITFTNQSNLGLNFSSAMGEIRDIGFISVGGTFINGTGSELDYSSNFTPTVSTFDVGTNSNTVLYANGNASPRNATYDRLVLRGSRTTTSGTITTNNMILEQTSPSLTLVDGTNIIIHGTLSLVGNNPTVATLDFGTGDATVVVNGDLIATNGTIIHNAGVGKTQLLELKGSSNELGLFTNTSTGISLVKYSSNITPQTVFTSPNYQNLEIAGGTVKTLQGATTVNNSLILTNGILSLNGFDLTLGTTATIGGTPSTGSYIFTGTNQVIKNISSGGSFTFPIGFGLTGTTHYAPVTVNYIGTTGSLIARSINGVSPTVSTANRLNTMWSITQTGLTLSSMTFNWQNGAITGSVASGASVYRENSSVWVTPASDGNSSIVNTNSATLTNTTNQIGLFTVFADPTISVSPSSLSTFATCEGAPSVEQSYTVSGTNLTNPIIITPPTGFEISKDGGVNYVVAPSTITLTQVAGTVNPTNILVRLSALTTAGSYGGTGNDITHTSTGISQNVAILTSSVNPNPTVTLSLLSSPVCPNSDANFVATPTGAAYSYVFSVNGNATPSSSSNMFTRNGLVTGDIVSVTVTDISSPTNCSNSASITMTVADNQAPTLTPLQNVTRNTDQTNCFYTNITTNTSPRIPNGIASDNCGVASYRYRLSGATLGDLSSLEAVRFNKGVTTVSWTATDRNGNISSPSQFTITIVDAQNPVIQAPQNITRLTNLYGCTSTRDSLNIGTPIVSDNCSFRVFNDAPTEFPLGETVVIWTAIDSAGNSSTAEQIITIEEQYYVIPSDSLILVQMYNEMGGASWSNRWDLNMPVSTWNGITVRCGKVAAINLFNNNLTGTLPRSVLNLGRRTESDFSLNIGGNRLSFESAEDFVGAISNFTYSPQAKIYAPRTENVRQSESITFTSQTEGNFNNYQWYKNQTPIAGATNWSYTIASAVPSDAGIYVCEVKNTVATRLTLERSPITLEVAGFLSPTDSLALVEIFVQTGGTTSWTEIWDLTQPVATWEGVTVSGDKIRELDLSSRNMTGRLPNVFDADLFSELRYLSFFDNKLEGEIPTSIGAITTLTYLDLDKNQFEGSVPASFGNLVNLQSLWLSRNNLTNLPDEIGNMRSLRTLYLNDNKFTSLPETIGNLSELLVLNVSDNELRDLPVSITNLRKLIQFYANRNYIASIPANIQNFVDLTTFEINTNNLTSLPVGLLQLIHLSNFRVTENQLEFDDLLPYSNRNYSIFDYAPQAPINEEADILVTLNSSISLTVQTQGDGNVYQWFRNGTSVATTQNFTISRVTNTDAGLYTAQITNPSLPNLTLQRRSIRLNVECQAGLNFGINQPQQTIFCEEQPFGLKLEINEGLITTSQIRWKKDGVVLAFANERTYTVTQAGIYTAEILTTNGCTALSNQVEITVQSQPEVTISLSNEKVLESTLNSPESVTYQWLKDGVAIENAFESTYTPTETAEYSLLVVTQLGCSSVSATIIFTADEVTGIEEPKELRNLVIFPNPNTGNFFIDFGTTTPNGEPSFVLIDAIGRQLVLKTERISSTRYKVRTNNLTGGMYYLQIQTKDGLAFRKFVIEE